MGTYDPFLFPDQQTLYLLWSERCRGRRMPCRSDIETPKLGPWLGRIHLLEVIDGGHDFKYLVFGTQIGQHFDLEMTGRFVSDWHEPIRSAGFATYRRIVQERRPYLIRQNEPAKGRMLCNHRLILPFSQDGEAVDHILTHMHVLAGVDGEPGVHYHALNPGGS